MCFQGSLHSHSSEVLHSLTLILHPMTSVACQLFCIICYVLWCHQCATLNGKKREVCVQPLWYAHVYPSEHPKSTELHADVTEATHTSLLEPVSTARGNTCLICTTNPCSRKEVVISLWEDFDEAQQNPPLDKEGHCRGHCPPWTSHWMDHPSDLSDSTPCESCLRSMDALSPTGFANVLTGMVGCEKGAECAGDNPTAWGLEMLRKN